MKRLTLLTSLLLLAGCAYDGAEYYPGDPAEYRSGPPMNGGVPAPSPGTPPSSDDPFAEPPPGDMYEAVGTNPFTVVAHDPFSTFAADVDTASYDIFVRDATNGTLPNAASVRLEEYVNSFDYAYPTPEPNSEVPFDIDLAAAAHPFRAGIAQLRVGIQASAPPEFTKLPTNLTFLVDVSGSMRSDDKLPLVKTVMRNVLDQLDANDTVSIVRYAGSTEVALPPTPITDRGAIEDAIARLVAGGSTAGADGMNLAYEQAEAAFVEGGFNHVVMCTDGDFNVGPSTNEELVALIEEKRRTGVTLTALGFGSGNLNDAMMERVSNAGNGVYTVITSEEHAVEYAQEGLLQGAHFVAQDMKIQVEFNPDHVVAYRLLGYENRDLADEDFRQDAVDAGEVGAGHRVTALYELVLTGQEIPVVDAAPEIADGERVAGQADIESTELVRVRVRWKDLGASEEDRAYETAESLTPEDVRAALDPETDRDFLWAAAIVAFAEIVKASPYGDPAHLDAIGEIVAAQADRDDDRAQFARLFAAVRSLL